MYTASVSTASASSTGMPSLRKRSVEASELLTAPRRLPLMAASASMNLLTVEPVPTPMMLSGGTWRKAAVATKVLSSSCVMPKNGLLSLMSGSRH